MARRDAGGVRLITRNGLDEFARLPLIMGKGAPEAAAPLLDAVGASRAVAARPQ